MIKHNGFQHTKPSSLQDATHSSTPLLVVVLAAGKGTRMNNPHKAKVMFELSGVPMIQYVVRQALSLAPTRVVVVVGFQKESVMEYLQQQFGNNVEFAHQDQQLGTGHAVRQAESALQGFEGNVLILSGDVPLLRRETLRAFVASHHAAQATVSVLSVDTPDPAGYGRIVRNSTGEFERIVEHKDASEEQRRISEINSGIYVVGAASLFTALSRVSNSNAQGEYYLTDIISILRAEGETVVAWKGASFEEVQGVNTLEQLEQAQEVLAAESEAVESAVV